MFSKDILKTISRMRNCRIHIDGYIREEIIMLNKLGILTYFCCAGHPRADREPYLVLDFSRYTADLLINARKLGITAEITVENNTTYGLVLVVYSRYMRKPVTYRHCRRFKQYLRDVVTVLMNPEVLKESNRRTTELSKKLGLPVYRASEVS